MYHAFRDLAAFRSMFDAKTIIQYVEKLEQLRINKSKTCSYARVCMVMPSLQATTSLIEKSKT